MSTKSIFNKIDQCHNKKLETIRELLEILSDNLFRSPSVSSGEKGTYILSGESVMSVMNTILTIDYCNLKKFYSDAFTLTRKYRDDLIQFLFLLDVIENMHGLSEEELQEFDIQDKDSFIKMIEAELLILHMGTRKNKEELAAEAFMYNTLDDEMHKKDRSFFDISKYIEYLNKNTKIKNMVDMYIKDKWIEINSCLNNYVHGNGLKYIQANFSIYPEKDINNKLIEIIEDITSIFLCILSLINGTKLVSSDYVDALDMGDNPPEGSQYWVSSVFVDYFDTHLEKDLLSYIEENNSYGMKFMLNDYA